MQEGRLTMVILAFQSICSVFAFFIRYQLAGVFYEVVR